MSNNGGPKNFKTMTFPPARDGHTTAVYAPLPPPPPPKTISVNEAERRAAQLKEMKKFINDQKCPVCNSPLEGPIGYDRAVVHCAASGGKEFKAQYKFGDLFPSWSVTTLYTTCYAFEVHNTHVTDDLFRNTIFQIDLTLNDRFQQIEKKELLNYEGARLFIKEAKTEQELLEKIKLYTLFS